MSILVIMGLCSLISILVGGVTFYHTSSNWVYLYFPLAVFLLSLVLFGLSATFILNFDIQIPGIEKGRLGESLGWTFLLVFPMILIPVTAASTLIFWLLRK